MSKNNILQKLFIGLFLICASAIGSAAQGTAFNFQGRLNDGANPANGAYDLQFRLYNALAGGAQIGAEIARPNSILIDGVFSVNLDFGAEAFINPNSIFIEIAVKPNGSPNAFTILGPRQQLTVVPFAVRANNATNADNSTNAVNALNAQNAVNAQNAQNAVNAQNAQNAQNATNAANATTATNSLSLGGVTASGYARLNFVNTGDVLTTGNLVIDGNARQLSTSSGIIKAMIFYNGTAIQRCYNGNTNSSTGDCGFVVDKRTYTDGGVLTYRHYRIDFGFPVSSRFFSITAQGAQKRTASILLNSNSTSDGCGLGVVMSVNTQCVVTQDPDEAHLPFYLIVY